MTNVIEVEICSALESIAFAWRRPSYIDTIAGLYALSFYGIEYSRLMRASYLPIRKVDDVVDGDARNIQDPLKYATELKNNISVDNLGKSPEEKLLQYALVELEKKAKAGDHPRNDFIRSIDAIIFDYNRAKVRRLLSAEEIEHYYREAFDPVLNITLMAIGSDLRIPQLAALSWGQGRIYSARDREEDWERGLINVPGKVVYSAGLTANSSFSEVEKSPVISNWYRDSLRKTKPDLLHARSVLDSSNEKQTQAVLGSLISPMLKIIEDF